MLHFEQGKNIEFVNDISKIIEKGDVQDVLQRNNQSDFSLYLKIGRNYNELAAYDQAIEALDKAIELNPLNKNAYFERAIAYFEKGNISTSLQDYLQSNLKPTQIDLDLKDSFDYAAGLLFGAAKGVKEGVVDYVPSILSSAQGLSHGLWSLVTTPAQVSKQVVEACKGCANFLKENASAEIVSKIVPELRELIEKKDEISSQREGEIIGYIIGKYGVEIFAGGVMVKCMKAYRSLKRANALLTMEVAAISEQNRIHIAVEAARKAEARKQVLRSANLQIRWNRQGKHIQGYKDYDPLRSEFTHPDPQGLVNKFAGTGQRINNNKPGPPNYRERINFKEIIGVYKNEAGTISQETTIGMIIYSNNGTHIIPLRPKDFL